MATQAQCERALTLFENELSQRKNVVGLGIVPLESEQATSGTRGLAVAVYVTKKLPANRLTALDSIPESLEVPGPLGLIQVPTRVIEQGEIHLEVGIEEAR